MTMAQNNRKDWFNLDGQNGNESFEEHNESMRRFCMSHTALEHNERMREFRKSHVSDLEMKVSRRDLIDKMWPLLVTDTLKETGGSRLLKDTLDWSILLPIQKVTACRFSAN